MEFDKPLLSGVLVKRHSRFLADVVLESGEEITAHTSNTGSMLGCQEPGSVVWLSISDNPKRKYPYTWEIVEVNTPQGRTPVGINTLLSNKLVAEGIQSGVVRELQGYSSIKTEVRYGKENSRIDLLLVADKNTESRPDCYVEVKNVTLLENDIAYFPDAVSKRGSKHLRELIDVVQTGGRAVIFYCVQRGDARCVKPANAIDREYADWLRRAVDAGVEAIAYRASVTSREIVLEKHLPVYCD